MSGRAVTSMLYNPNRDDARNEWTRVEIDEDNGFRAYKGGVSLMYDARPATFLGATPQLGFGLGGVINRYSELEDKTALYLEGNFGLSFQPLDDLRIIARADLAIFAFEVDELGYSEMVSYKNFTVGAAWFIDTVPAEVRAKHLADQKKARPLRPKGVPGRLHLRYREPGGQWHRALFPVQNAYFSRCSRLTLSARVRTSPR
ncbi:MAG: hypothetical protein IPI48_12320 [bacterium]|nr:hypothetical protein [bacterium]